MVHFFLFHCLMRVLFIMFNVRMCMCVFYYITSFCVYLFFSSSSFFFSSKNFECYSRIYIYRFHHSLKFNKYWILVWVWVCFFFISCDCVFGIHIHFPSILHYIFIYLLLLNKMIHLRCNASGHVGARAYNHQKV